MKRRHFIEVGILGLGALSLNCSQPYSLINSEGHLNNDGFTYLLSHKIDATLLPVPADMRAHFNWKWFGLHKKL